MTTLQDRLRSCTYVHDEYEIVCLNNSDEDITDEAADRIDELESDVKFWNTCFIEQRDSAEKEVARLSCHIKQIAEHHQRQIDHFRGNLYITEINTERRDFALSVFTSQTATDSPSPK